VDNKGEGWQMVFKQRWPWTTRERDGKWFLNRSNRKSMGKICLIKVSCYHQNEMFHVATSLDHLA